MKYHHWLALLVLGCTGSWATAQNEIQPDWLKAGRKQELDDHAERAIKDALQWQAKQQKPDGRWVVAKDIDLAGTALGVLTLLGTGQGHPDAKYPKELENALKFVILKQRADGSFDKADQRQQALVTLALCEASRNVHVRLPAQRALDFILKSQREDGGWSATVLDPSDLETSAWCVLAVKSAEANGLKVAPLTLPAFAKYLETLSAENGTGYAPKKGEKANDRATALGVAMRCCLGEAKAAVRGLENLRKKGIPENIDSVHLLFLTIGLKKANQPDEFKAWYVELRKQLPHIQEVQGNWLPDMGEEADGTVLVTFYRLLALEACLTAPAGQVGLTFFR